MTTRTPVRAASAAVAVALAASALTPIYHGVGWEIGRAHV